MLFTELFEGKDACPVCGQTPCNCTNIAEGLRDPKDNPCWKGYHPVGTKQKGGRTVPNCVPKEGVEEGYLSNPGQEDSPVVNAITRRIIAQRTDLLAKYGPEKVAAAIDEVADFVGDVEEIGSSDVSGWVRHVEQMLGNMEESQVNEISTDPRYLSAAERSRSQAQDTQRQYWKSPEEKAAARQTELKRDKGIAGYSKRHRAANPEMYPKVTPRPAPRLRDPSTEYSDDYSVWAAGRRDTMEQDVAEGKDNLESLKAKAKQISDKIDSIVQSGGRVGLDDPLSRQLKAIRNKIKQAKQGVSEAIPYALSAANANAEYRRQGQAGGGYRGRVDIPVGSSEDYRAAGQALAKAARAAGQKIEYGLSNNVMSVFSDSMTSDELDEFIDNVLEQGLDEGRKKPEPPEADYGDEYQAMVARVKKLAGLGPLKTVWDPVKRVYKNVPVAQQPTDKK